MSTIRVRAPFRRRIIGRPELDQFTSPKGARPKHSAWDDIHPVQGAATAGLRPAWPTSYSWKLRITDSLIIVAVMSVAYLLWFGAGSEGRGGSAAAGSYFVTGLILLVLWTLDLEFCRTREMGVVGAGALEYKRVLESTLRVFGAVAITMVALHIEIVRGFFAVAFPLGVVSLLTARWIWRRWLARQREHGHCLTNAVILGQAVDVQYVIGQLKNNLSTGYKVVGVALTSLDKSTEMHPPWQAIPVLSSMADIGRVVGVTGAQSVIVAGPLPGGPSAIRDLGWRLEDMSTELVLASSLTNVAGPRIHFRPVEGLPLMHVELPQYSGGRHVIKRVMDVLLSGTALLMLLPLMLVLGLIVKLDSKGPALFFQNRVGRNGETFKMAKFRSMVVDAEAQLKDLAAQNEGSGVLFKMAGDPRITRCGRWMRKYSLDELPQFWNVLLGNMSLVGPRPPLTSEVESYEKPVHRRLLIKPGITGLWQVGGRSNLGWEESVRLDLYYVENWSITGDFIILWRTFKTVLMPNGAY